MCNLDKVMYLMVQTIPRTAAAVYNKPQCGCCCGCGLFLNRSPVHALDNYVILHAKFCYSFELRFWGCGLRCGCGCDLFLNRSSGYGLVQFNFLKFCCSRIFLALLSPSPESSKLIIRPIEILWSRLPQSNLFCLQSCTPILRLPVTEKHP